MGELKRQARLVYFATHIGCEILVDYPSSNYPQREVCSLKYIASLQDKTESLSNFWKWNKLVLKKYDSEITLPNIDKLRFQEFYTGKFMGFDPIAEGWCVVE